MSNNPNSCFKASRVNGAPIFSRLLLSCKPRFPHYFPDDIPAYFPYFRCTYEERSGTVGHENFDATQLERGIKRYARKGFTGV